MPEQSACVRSASSTELHCQQFGPFAFYCEVWRHEVYIFHVA